MRMCAPASLYKYKLPNHLLSFTVVGSFIRLTNIAATAHASRIVTPRRVYAFLGSAQIYRKNSRAHKVPSRRRAPPTRRPHIHTHTLLCVIISTICVMTAYIKKYINYTALLYINILYLYGRERGARNASFRQPWRRNAIRPVGIKWNLKSTYLRRVETMG